MIQTCRKFGSNTTRFLSRLRTYVSTREVDNIGIIEFDDPERMNAMTVEMGEVFENAVNKYSILASQQKIRAVIIKGKGRCFSAGGDLAWLKQRATASTYENNITMIDFYNRFLCIKDLPVPTIAAIHGAAIGAGLAVTLACDIRLATVDAKMGVTFAALGIHPGMGSSLLLPRLIGHQHAAYMHLSGALLSGIEGKETKLVLDAVPGGREEVIDRAVSIAEGIAKKAPIAVRTGLLTLRHEKFCGLDSALEREADSQALCYASEDFKKGLEAVASRSTAEFQGW